MSLSGNVCQATFGNTHPVKLPQDNGELGFRSMLAIVQRSCHRPLSTPSGAAEMHPNNSNSQPLSLLEQDRRKPRSLVDSNFSGPVKNPNAPGQPTVHPRDMEAIHGRAVLLWSALSIFKYLRCSSTAGVLFCMFEGLGSIQSGYHLQPSLRLHSSSDLEIANRCAPWNA